MNLLKWWSKDSNPESGSQVHALKENVMLPSHYYFKTLYLNHRLTDQIHPKINLQRQIITAQQRGG